MRVDGLATVASDQIRILRNGLHIMALRALGDVDAADDVVQETLLRALKAVTPEMAADPARLGAFVGGIARHVIADARRAAARHAARQDSASEAAAGEDVLSRVVAHETGQHIRAAIARLAIDDQVVVRASFFEGLTPLEIAARLNQPVERVRKRKSRALARLRAALAPLAGHESGSASSNNGRLKQPHGER